MSGASIQLQCKRRKRFEHFVPREWFAVNGPRDAPPLPLSYDDVEDYRKARGLTGVVGFYARSLSRQGYGRRSYDVRNHPSFHDFACGLMAIGAPACGASRKMRN